ncbi:hypothetical protein HYZ70_03440 [Candidatus Curtissbacteria bacterium]|nr:hypothetical protein [Candidatus Curtissbacteria bacterium]
MNRLDYLNLSTDLRRISQWLMDGQDDMVVIFMPRIRAKFGNDKLVVGKRSISKWLGEVERFQNERKRAAEMALTLSSILL